MNFSINSVKYLFGLYRLDIKKDSCFNNKVMEKEQRKKFSCPKCGARFPVLSMFTLKDHVVCRKCKSKMKPKKQVITFQGGFFSGLIVINGTIYILFYYGYDYWSLIYAALVGIIGLIIVCVITYIKTEFVEY
jgi:predicted RNA-binding Zn-ribbon protein involved in translation (DUF1610 family)